MLGGRLGYVLFYKPAHYAAHPLEIFAVWQGGMSFHGGLLGVILAMWIYARRQGVDFLRLTDFLAPLCPLGIAAGRLGNFINGELYGRVTDLPWGMVFRHAGDAPRHPSQLYQFALEGLALFVLLWWFSVQAAAARPGVRRCSLSATAFFASSPSSAASPMPSSACWPSASPWASGCACP